MKSIIAGSLLLLTLTVPVYAANAHETVIPKFNHAIPNIPGKSLIAVEVDYAPGAKSMPHHHANSAFIFAYVLSGAIKSQVEGEPVKVFHEGESWYENPGAHHLISENASSTEPAKLLAVFVVDSSDKVLTRSDQKPQTGPHMAPK